MRKEDAVIGARVIAVAAVDGKDTTYNKAGTIIISGSRSALYDICVEFDDYIDGHNGYVSGKGPTGRDGHCWWGMFDDFELEGIEEDVEIKLSFDELLGEV